MEIGFTGVNSQGLRYEVVRKHLNRKKRWVEMETGQFVAVWCQHVKTGAFLDPSRVQPYIGDHLIGATVRTAKSGEAVVSAVKGYGSKARALLRFPTGGEVWVSARNIRSGEIRDPEAVYSRFGVVGKWPDDFPLPTGVLKRVYRLWYGMVRRCLDETNISYSTYGAKGVTVCSQWLKFAQFAHDCLSLPGFKEWEASTRPREWHLDKDLRGSGLLYGPESCCFIRGRDNVGLANRKRAAKSDSQDNHS